MASTPIADRRERLLSRRIFSRFLASTSSLAVVGAGYELKSGAVHFFDWAPVVTESAES